MALFTGEAVVIKASAKDPIRNEPITDAVGTVLLYAPPKNPKVTPADRTPDGDPIAMIYDAELDLYTAFVDTTGFAPGKWWFKVELASFYETWEYGSFTLKA